MAGDPVYPYRRTLTLILAMIGVNAIFAGYGFMGTPDGSAVGIPQEWLADTPFKDYMVPGAILFGLGVLHICAAYLQLRRDPIATMIAGVSGSGLIIWIAVQAAMMGSFRHPVQTILQAVCLVLALTTIYLAWKQSKRHAEVLRSQEMPA